jgi:hypothetical protein
VIAGIILKSPFFGRGYFAVEKISYFNDL